MLSRWDYAICPTLNYATHDDHVMAKSATLLRHHLNNLLGRDRTYRDYPEFYPSVSSRDAKKPCTQFPHLFYCGINWERLSDAKGRYDDLLSLLDNKGTVCLYGPEEFNGKKLWAGFKSYKGEIPFDGTSILDRIHDCGISLVLSSEVHFSNETSSSRIYESCAAGSVIISDDNAFITREFGDSVLYFKRTGIAALDAEQIEKQFQWIQSNPAEAARMAKHSQQIFLEKFSLEYVFKRLAADYAVKRQKFLSPASAPTVTVALRVPEEKAQGLDEAIDSIKEQNYPNFEVIVQCSPKLVDVIQKKLGGITQPITWLNIDDFHEGKRTCRKGKCLSSLFEHMKNDFLALIEPGWKWNYDHISTLVTASGTEANLTMNSIYQFVDDTTAPETSPRLERFCDAPQIQDFEEQRVLIDLPAFLIPRHLLDTTSDLSVLFEHYEAMLLFVEAAKSRTKFVFTRKFTVARLSKTQLALMQTPKTEYDQASSFWARISSKLDNPDYELKLLYDRVRVQPHIDMMMKYWLAEKAGAPRASFTTGMAGFGIGASTGMLVALSKALQAHSPKEYYLARLAFRTFGKIVRLIPFRARK